jgi:hypothetical protein
MFTLIAIGLMGVLAWVAHRTNDKDRQLYEVDARFSDDSPYLRTLLLHIRQDLKLVAFLLAGIMILLGILADQVRPGASFWH